ncbi:MAG: acyltransferase [Thermoanaerobaculia bacterium]
MNRNEGSLAAPGDSLTPDAPSGNPTNAPLGALRAALTLLVVAHHAVLAYHPWAPPPALSLLAEPRLWPAFPIVDAHRTSGLDLFVGWNDTYFMSLLFLIAGVFAWPSLVRKGAATYLRDRVRRLGVPFLVGAGLLAPLAYLPTYLAAVRAGAPQPGSFVAQWLALGSWPAGPVWFLWVLLAWSAGAALAYRFLPRWGESLGQWSGCFGRRPIRFAIALISVSAAAYLPLATHFTAERWVDFGPFWIQISRSLLYAVYFVAGIGLGACGRDRGLLEPGGKLARRWPLWAVAAALSFGVAVAALLGIVGSMQKGGPGILLLSAGHLAFVTCCALTSLAALAIFLRFAQKPLRPGSWLGSLSANAFGIYLLHYACVSWLQLELLPVSLAGFTKPLIVFSGAVAASWTMTALLRRIPAVARIL